MKKWGSKKLPSLQITLMAVFAASWLIPIAVFSFFIFYTYQNAYIEKSDNLIKNAVNVSGVLVMNEIDEAVTKMQKPTYEGEWESMFDKYAKGKVTRADYLTSIKASLISKFYMDDQIARYAFYMTGDESACCYSGKNGYSYEDYMTYVQPVVDEVMQKDSDYVEVYIIDNQIYLMRNLYTVKDYKKYVANCDEVTMYAKDCQYSYQSDKGKINATMTGNQIHFYPVSFSKEELKKMKIDIWEKCKNKIFVNEYGTDSHNHVIYHDWKKQKVCTDFSIKNNETNTYGNVKGESLIMPGKYDRLYPDADMYSIDKVEKYDRKDKMMNEAADLYYNKKGEKSGYFTLYGMILFVFLVLLDLVYTVILGIPLGVLFLIFDW